MLEVVAGLLFRDGQLLLCQRLPNSKHALKWEFPGGKVEAGETAAEALVRELREELGIAAVAGEEITRYEFAYAGREPIELIFFAVYEWRGEVENLNFNQMVWAGQDRLTEFDFLEGDLPVLPLLQNYAFKAGR